MKINLLYNFSNRVFDVNLRKRIAASCYYLLPVETKLIIKYWIFKKKKTTLRGHLKTVHKV